MNRVTLQMAPNVPILNFSLSTTQELFYSDLVDSMTLSGDRIRSAKSLEKTWGKTASVNQDQIEVVIRQCSVENINNMFYVIILGSLVYDVGNRNQENSRQRINNGINIENFDERRLSGSNRPLEIHRWNVYFSGDDKELRIDRLPSYAELNILHFFKEFSLQEDSPANSVLSVGSRNRNIYMEFLLKSCESDYDCRTQNDEYGCRSINESFDQFYNVILEWLNSRMSCPRSDRIDGDYETEYKPKTLFKPKVNEVEFVDEAILQIVVCNEEFIEALSRGNPQRHSDNTSEFSVYRMETYKGTGNPRGGPLLTNFTTGHTKQFSMTRWVEYLGISGENKELRNLETNTNGESSIVSGIMGHTAVPLNVKTANGSTMPIIKDIQIKELEKSDLYVWSPFRLEVLGLGKNFNIEHIIDTGECRNQFKPKQKISLRGTRSHDSLWSDLKRAIVLVLLLRELNSVTIKDCYPITKYRGLLSRQAFTVAVDRSTNVRYMPFGLCNAKTMMRLMRL
ncbi:hypothetical protein CVS40_10612 [Lucilia cuprina]|nr:hypothetical protein CVS40_10612 [Lucilia cuprina]